MVFMQTKHLPTMNHEDGEEKGRCHDKPHRHVSLEQSDDGEADKAIRGGPVGSRPSSMEVHH